MPTQIYTSDHSIGIAAAGPLIMICYGSSNWDDKIWDEHLDLAERVAGQEGSSALPEQVSMSVIRYGTPSARQRRVAADRMQDRKGTTRLAVVTNSGLTRMAGNALQKLRPFSATTIQMYKPADYIRALDWLKARVDFDALAAKGLELCAGSGFPQNFFGHSHASDASNA